jgi:superfamily II DNA/RNA helicase
LDFGLGRLFVQALLFISVFPNSLSLPADLTSRNIMAKGESSKMAQEPPAPTATTDSDLADRQPFSTLELSEPTAKGLAQMGFTHMTPVQEKSIPPLLAGKDVLGAAQTGSGKTLAFLVPAVELLHRMKFKPHNGQS